ncbi:MAG: hypothetical protein GY703_10375 [Gammaproteobacteria bacterium]|nr:hypothetical protein [Gammaproteobacteria bacterium]
MSSPLLLAIVEMGGYSDFIPLYRKAGFEPVKVHSLRKAQGWLKKNRPAVIVTEFHFDPELRDRMSNLESLFATLQRFAVEAKVIVFMSTPTGLASTNSRPGIRCTPLSITPSASST